MEPAAAYYEPCSAHLSYAGEGFGDFIHYAYQGKSGSSDDICSAITQIASNMGPAGPIIGAKSTSGEPDPFQGETANPAETALSRRGTVYAPFQIARLAAVDGAELSIYYDMSTWNPYTVVLMQSNFSIAPPVFEFP